MKALSRLLWAVGASLWLVSSSSSASVLDYESAWACTESKFNWYCDQEPEVEEATNKPKADEKVSKKQSEEEKALAELERIRKELDGKRAIAILNPTQDNLKSYIAAQETAMDKASTFSDSWRRTIWQNPQLNYELKRPVNNAAIASYNQARKDAEYKTMDQIRNEWGIFFFFRSDCVYCHRLAPTLKFLSEQHGIAIFPISGDGGALKEFPNPQRDNGMGEMLNVSVYPTLVLGNTKNRRMIPLSSGLISAKDIVERIYVLTSTKPGELY